MSVVIPASDFLLSFHVEVVSELSGPEAHTDFTGHTAYLRALKAGISTFKLGWCGSFTNTVKFFGGEIDMLMASY